MRYDISKEDVKIFKATTTSDKEVVEYHLQKGKDGWIITSLRYHTDSPWPLERFMFLPYDVVENIILKEHVKKELKK